MSRAYESFGRIHEHDLIDPHPGYSIVRALEVASSDMYSDPGEVEAHSLDVHDDS